MSTFDTPPPHLTLHNIFTYFVIFSTWLFLLETFKALNGLLCADVPLRNYSLTYITVLQTLPQKLYNTRLDPLPLP